MFGTGTFYTPQSNFFVDYMYTRIALTNKKNQELAKLEIDAQNRKERGLKDEEVRLRNNITRLQQSLLNREQAYISRTYKRDQQTSAQRTGNDVRGSRAQAAERTRIDTRWDKEINEEKREYDAAQNRLRAAESDIGNHATNLSINLRTALQTDSTFFDINNARAQEKMLELYRTNQKSGQRGNNAPSPIDIARGGSVFILMYKQILEDFGQAEADAFQHAIVTGYPAIDVKYRTQAVLGGAGSGSWEDEFRLYGSDQNIARIQEMNVARRKEKAEVPDFGAGSGSSSSRTSTGGGAPAAPLAETETTLKTQKMIEDYETRLKEVMGEREGAEGARADIIERRLGRKGLAATLTPFEYVDEDVQSILDEVLGIEDEDVRRETLEEGRMLVSGPRGKIANEFVESQVLNEEAIRGHFSEASTRWLQSSREMAQADAALVRLRANLNEIRAASDDPEYLDTVSPQIEALVANINRQERRAREAEEQHDLYGQIHDQLKPLVGSERGVAAEWSAMGPRERLMVLQGINAGAVAKASSLSNRISTTRETIQLLEDEVRDIESDVGSRSDRSFQDNDAAVAALQELEGDKQALQALLVEQNRHLNFSGEATGTIDFLVENDPDYRIEPPALRGLGTEAPASAVLTADQEEELATTFGDVGQRKGEEEGVEGVEEARQLMSDVSLRDLNVEEAKKSLEALLEVPEPTDSQQQSIRDLERFLASKEAQLEARPESEDVGDDVAVPEQRPEEPDYTYELQTPGSVRRRDASVEGVTPDVFPGVQGQEVLRSGRSMRELARQVYGDDTLDVAPSPEPKENDEFDFEFGSAAGLIEEGDGDFKPGGFETQPAGGAPEITADYDKEPELWREQYDQYVDSLLRGIGDSLNQEPSAAPIQAPTSSYLPERKPRTPPVEMPQIQTAPVDFYSSMFPEPKPVTTPSGAITARGIIDGVRAVGSDPEWLVSHLNKGFQLSHELVDVVEEKTQNAEFENQLKKLPEEKQAEWESIWSSMTDWRENRAPPRDDDLLQNSMPREM